MGQEEENQCQGFETEGHKKGLLCEFLIIATRKYPICVVEKNTNYVLKVLEAAEVLIKLSGLKSNHYQKELLSKARRGILFLVSSASLLCFEPLSQSLNSITQSSLHWHQPQLSLRPTV